MEWNGAERNGIEWNVMEWKAEVGMESNGTERHGMEWKGMEKGKEWQAVPTLGRGDVGRSLPFAHGTVCSLGVAVISRDLTRTYSGRRMEWEWTGLGDRVIESLRRIHL